MACLTSLYANITIVIVIHNPSRSSPETTKHLNIHSLPDILPSLSQSLFPVRNRHRLGIGCQPNQCRRCALNAASAPQFGKQLSAALGVLCW
jgi:hypothetical protein